MQLTKEHQHKCAQETAEGHQWLSGSCLYVYLLPQKPSLLKAVWLAHAQPVDTVFLWGSLTAEVASPGFWSGLLRWNVCEEPYSCTQFLLPAGNRRAQWDWIPYFHFWASPGPRVNSRNRLCYVCLPGNSSCKSSPFLKETWSKSENFRSWVDSLTAERSG